MHGPMPLIATLAVGLGLALLFGLLAQRLRLPPLVGYLLAGMLIGPHTPGFVGDAGVATQLAEIGVMLLMFGVGLHFSWQDLLAVRRTAVPGALLQMAVATGLGALMARAFGLGWGGALVFGLSLSVASTVVLLRALEARHELATGPGRLAVGWLVVEDLAMVIALVMLPALAPMLQGASGSNATAWMGRCAAQDLAGAGRLRASDGRAGPARPALAAVAGDAHRFARAVHAVPSSAAAVSLAYGGAAQGLACQLRAGRLLGRHGAARIGIQPNARPRTSLPLARRLRGAVLRLGGHAVRPRRYCGVHSPCKVLAVHGRGAGGQDPGRRAAGAGAWPPACAPR
jgi:CPA2 family monovalent cation:H+ antiporter-2